MASNPLDFLDLDDFLKMSPRQARNNLSMMTFCSNISRQNSMSASTSSSSSFFVRQRIILDIYVVSALCMIGFVGNALTIAVLHRDRLQDGSSTATNWLLRSLAAMDTIYLVACLFIQTAKTAYEFTDQFPDSLRTYFPYVEQYVWPVAAVVHTMTVWTVLLVTVDRYIAVCRPFDTRLRTAERVKLMFAALCVMSVLYNVPQFFERRVEETTNTCTGEVTRKIVNTPLRDNDIYYVVYKTAGNLVFRTLGPLVTLLVLNAFLIRALHEARRRQKKLANSSMANSALNAAPGGGALASKRRRSSSRHRENITLMLVAVVSVFIVCQLPDLGLRIATIGRSDQTATKLVLTAGERKLMTPVVGTSNSPSVTSSIGDGSTHRGFIRYVNSITNVLMVFNSAINFLIYCLVGKKFRRIFIEMFFGADTLCERRCPCVRRQDQGRGREKTALVTEGVEPTELGRRTMLIGTGNAGQRELPSREVPRRSLQVLPEPVALSAECIAPLSERELRVEKLPEDAEKWGVCEKTEAIGPVAILENLSTSGEGGRISVEVNQNVLDNNEETLIDKQQQATRVV